MRGRNVTTRLVTCFLVGSALAQAGEKYFQITVVDDQTGRGVPLVELTTTNSIRCYTDSNGIVAFHEPGLMNRKVFFTVKSHGYEFPKDGFGIAGRALETTEGGSATLKIRRINIAERLYRITGQGIYRDSIMVGIRPPIDQPVINGLVMGQDSIQNAIYKGRYYWFWGDTGWPEYPLGNFHMSGATTPLPGEGALDPDVGVNLAYFVRENGFAKEMAPRPEPGPVWCDAFVTLPDETGRERMFAAYSRVTPTMEAVERGLMRFNDDKEIFEKIVEFDLKSPVHPGGHPFLYREGGTEYVWFPQPFPLVRVRADAKALGDLSQYEAWTPLKEGSRLDSPQIDRAADGAIRYAWKKNTPMLGPKEEAELVKKELLRSEETLTQLRDVDSGKAVTPHSGSVYWNAYRKRWITIRCEIYGTSMLGETWYAEADTPLGPWVYARKIVTHDKYSFYNPKQHPLFDKEGGRIIYFEGTYTYTFSGSTDPTPRYDYNQIMYKLDLADPRLALPVAVYDLSDDGVPDRFGTARDARTRNQPVSVAFFAPDRPAPGTVPVCAAPNGQGLAVPSTSSTADAGTSGELPLFYAIPADAKNPPATTTPLYEFVEENGKRRAYTADADWSRQGFRRSPQPLCRVWKSPTCLRFTLD